MNARPTRQFSLFVIVIIARNSSSDRASRCADGRAALGIAIARIVVDGRSSRSANGCARQRRTRRHRARCYGDCEHAFE